MTTVQSSLDVAIEMLRDLQEFGRSGSKEAFRKQSCEEFVRRLGAAGPNEALAMALVSLVPFCLHGNAASHRPSRENQTISRSGSLLRGSTKPLPGSTKVHKDSRGLGDD
jgi:hypothetical protein